MNIIIPRHFDKDSINGFLSQILTENREPIASEINLDLTKIHFITPGGVAALYNISEWLISKNVNATVTTRQPKDSSDDKNIKVMKYLEDVGFFQTFLGVDNRYKTTQLRKTTLPLKTVGIAESHGWFEYTLKAWLQHSTGRNDQFTNIQVAIEEIFNNISDHSTETIGCVFAQFFPKIKKITIAISDLGVGIPNVMRTIYPDLNDLNLLLEAINEGISTKSTPKNRGAGLPNIIRSLTNDNIGKVHIFSNYARIDIENKKVANQIIMDSYYPGTFFEIDIDLTNESLYEAEEEENFEW